MNDFKYWVHRIDKGEGPDGFCARGYPSYGVSELIWQWWKNGTFLESCYQIGIC